MYLLRKIKKISKGHKIIGLFGFIFFLSFTLSANTQVPDNTSLEQTNPGPVSLGTQDMTHQMPQVMLQIAFVLFASFLGGKLARLAKLPSVLGQIFAGMLIGPFALGSLALPGFPQGLFPPLPGAIPVSPMIYTLSTLASIILLFVSGLETDLSLFKRYALKGSIVGVSGVVFSFITGAFLTSFLLHKPFGAPICLFMGSLSVATSVGITASILSAQRKIDSPEGTVILSAAVIDDILGIIILAIVLGITAHLNPGTDAQQASQALESGRVSVAVDASELPTGASTASTLALDIFLIALKAIGIWLVTTFLGLKFSRQLGKFLKVNFKDRSMLAVMSFGIALLLAGIFEEAGLSMIIGAYLVGLSLSNTDLAYVIHSRIKTLHDFLVPVFFAVSGMMLNFKTLASWEVLGFGALFSLIAILAKLLGSGGASLFLGFNLKGALRIGWGMVPRGEVALIIAGIGVSSGILDNKIFGVSLLMTISTTIIAPPVLNILLKSKQSGQKKAELREDRTETTVDFETPEFAELLISKFLTEMEQEGFFVNRIDHDEDLYQLRKDDVFISMIVEPSGLVRFISETSHVQLFQTALYEGLLNITETAANLKTRFKPSEMAANLSKESAKARTVFDIRPYIAPELVAMHLRGTNKEEILKEMISLFVNYNLVEDEAQVLSDVLEREKSMSTGMQKGIAIPHAKTEGIQNMKVAIGLKPEGLDFNSLDGEPSKIFMMILSPKQGFGPHLQLLAVLAGLLSDAQVRESLLEADSYWEVLRIIDEASKMGKK